MSTSACSINWIDGVRGDGVKWNTWAPFEALTKIELSKGCLVIVAEHSTPSAGNFLLYSH